MNKLDKITSHWGTKIVIFALMFLGWLLPYLCKDYLLSFEAIGQIIIAIIASACLLFCSDTFLVLEILILFPFMFARPLNVYIIPVHLYVVVGLVLASFVAHFIIHKTKFIWPKFMIGFIAIAVSMVLGGLLVSYEDKFLKMLLLAGIAIAFLAFYICLSSSTKPKFADLAFLMTLLGSLLILQYGVWALLNMDKIASKYLYLGWANSSNNVGMMLLFTFPFICYFGFVKKGIKSILYFLLATINIFVIIFTFSRGSMLALFVTALIMAISLGIYKPTRTKALRFVMFFFVLALIGVILISIINFSFMKQIINLILSIDLSNLNGRWPIYEMIFQKFSEQPIFGQGIYAFYDVNNFYLWGHNTFLQALHTMGILGFLAVLWHHIEKYYFCCKKITFEKAIILFSFIATDIYGFLDVSYFFINFMVVLFVILIACNKMFDEPEEVLNVNL